MALLGHAELIAEQFDQHTPEQLKDHVLQIRASAHKLYATRKFIDLVAYPAGLMPYQPEFSIYMMQR
jgi:hypothetical protein